MERLKDGMEGAKEIYNELSFCIYESYPKKKKRRRFLHIREQLLLLHNIEKFLNEGHQNV